MKKRVISVVEFSRSGFILREAFRAMAPLVVPGTTTRALDEVALRKIELLGGRPAFLNYQGFPATCCISVNDEVVHCIPSERALQEGDIVSVDCGVIFDGVYTDSCRTYPVGRISEDKARLIDITEQALMAGIEAAVPGKRLGDISHAVQRTAELAGFNVSREFVGHAIGTKLHMLPWVPNYGRANTGQILKEGMCLAIEPIVFAGGWHTRSLGSWGIVSKTGVLSAHTEDTVFIGPNGPVNITR